MSGTVVGINLNLGYAGDISRSIDPIVDARTLASNIVNSVEQNAPVAFGEPVVLNSDNTYSRFGATGTAATFGGIAIREVKQATDYFNPNGQYIPGEKIDALVRGYAVVKCNNGTPSAGGAVYIRTVANVSIPNGVVGQFEATADGTNTILIPNLKWTTGKLDANNIAEVTITSIVNP